MHKMQRKQIKTQTNKQIKRECKQRASNFGFKAKTIKMFAPLNLYSICATKWRFRSALPIHLGMCASVCVPYTLTFLCRCIPVFNNLTSALPTPTHKLVLIDFNCQHIWFLLFSLILAFAHILLTFGFL